MKHWKLSLSILLILAVLFVPLAGCAEQTEDPENSADVSPSDSSSDTAFSYSDYLDENGFWEGVKALDYVDLGSDYKALSLPSEAHTISDEALQDEVDSMLAYYTTTEQVTDRAVEDGDTLNIDYVGSVDGVEFENGSTEGAGTTVTIGVTNFIDDFLEQLIGHTPGESFDIEVTFPDPYQNNEELSGKDAVFAITINYIEEKVEAKLTDAFVEETFGESNSISTVNELKDLLRDELQKEAIESFIQEYMIHDVSISSVPDSLLKYQEEGMISYYTEYASYYSMELDEFLSTYVQVESVEALKEEYLETNTEAARYYLVSQAIAEDQGFTADETAVQDYFTNVEGIEDYSEYEEAYGMPYLKMIALNQMVLDYLIENAVLA